MSRQLSGLLAWVVQRLSAVYIGLFLVIATVSFLVNGLPASYPAWRSLLSAPLPNLALLVFILALLLHAWVGIRDVLIDYVHAFALRFSLLSLFALGILSCGLWAMRILFRLQG